MTALVTAQLTATKVLAFDIPFSVPIAGNSLILPGASLAIAILFFASDCYAELYGRRAAQILVNVGFAMNFVLMALVWSTILAPAAPSSVDPSAFASVLGASTNIVIGSLIAYLVSQNFDVLAFHAIREATDGKYLWLRNVASTATSQILDTVIFVGIAFLVAPTLFGLGDPLPTSVILPLVVGQYLLKLLIAIIDTPFVYLVVELAGRPQFRSGPRLATE
ncbi:MAG: queuosine precursor transporter [Halodesulfurarchaeum sp.]